MSICNKSKNMHGSETHQIQRILASGGGRMGSGEGSEGASVIIFI